MNASEWTHYTGEPFHPTSNEAQSALFGSLYSAAVNMIDVTGPRIVASEFVGR